MIFLVYVVDRKVICADDAGVLDAMAVRILNQLRFKPDETVAYSL